MTETLSVLLEDFFGTWDLAGARAQGVRVESSEKAGLGGSWD